MKPALDVLQRPGMLRESDFQNWLPEPFVAPEPEEEEDEEEDSESQSQSQRNPFDLTKGPPKKAKSKTKSKSKSKTKRASSQLKGPAQGVVLSKGKSGSKTCTKCGETRDLVDFRPHDTTADGYAAYCRLCQNELNKNYRNKNMPMRIKHHFATRVRDQFSIRSIDLPKRYVEDLEEYLGYSMQELYEDLDRRVRDEFDITAKDALLKGWHIDHVRPLRDFDVRGLGDPTFRECWAISNLRIIPAEDNLAKGSSKGPGPTNGPSSGSRES